MCGAGTPSKGRQNLQKAPWTSELFVWPCDPKWKTCVTLPICGTWQAGARQELWGLLGFPPPFLFLAVILILLKIHPFQLFDSYFFFSSSRAARKHPVQLKSIQVQSCRIRRTQKETHWPPFLAPVRGQECVHCTSVFAGPHSKVLWWISFWMWMLAHSPYHQALSWDLIMMRKCHTVCAVGNWLNVLSCNKWFYGRLTVYVLWLSWKHMSSLNLFYSFGSSVILAVSAVHRIYCQQELEFPLLRIDKVRKTPIHFQWCSGQP